MLKGGIIMDIASLSMSLASQELGTAVGVALTKMNMETIEQNGAALVNQLSEMELSVNPNVGSQIDIRL
ncbi:MAG: putative motility protein [Cellulosilyticum sp.]|nr:putative motility protein [Cellulosilyticum sp.]